MSRTAICVFLCIALSSAQARGQADGIAERQTESGITIVEGFVTSPGNNDWVIAEFQDAFGVVGYSYAFVDTQTGYLFAVKGRPCENGNGCDQCDWRDHRYASHEPRQR